MTAKKKQKKVDGFIRYQPPTEDRPIYSRNVEITCTNGKVSQTTTFIHARDGPAPHQNRSSEAGPSSHATQESPLQVGDALQPGALPKRKRAPAAEATQAWTPLRDIYLKEIIGLEGRSDRDQTTCRSCKADTTAPLLPHFECVDCFSRELQCQACIVREHENLPLHRIREWNGKFYRKRSLKELGLRIQLGHRRGERCIVPEQCHSDDFVIVDITGLHSVGVDFCGCGKTCQSRVQQLLSSRLFPATVTQPRTAATFQVLHFFELLSYESKVSSLEFYQALDRITDNTKTQLSKNRYSVFLRINHQWRHLRMMKRAGRGHSPEGVDGSKEGECALLCPACPQPGINMPNGWENAPESERFLHALFIALDANFRLKRKGVSNDVADPGFNHGSAYVVEESAYKAHLENYKQEEEPKTTCSRHDAVLLSDSKPSRGHAATGVGTVECSRHDMKRPTAVGDLQRGERYCNMDYIFWRSLQGSQQLTTLVVSYDIACQWSVNLKARLDAYSPLFFLWDQNTKIIFLVPKFHLPAHIEWCRTRFSFNYTPGVGRTDGEAPERGWAEANGLATSTREMGPGTRRDTFDFHFGDYNWRKIVGLAESLWSKLWNAAVGMAEQTIQHTQFEATIPSPTVQIWHQEVVAWEEDPKSNVNPFEVKIKGPTQAAVRLQLAEEEAKALAAGKDFSLDEKVTPSVLIMTGIELEAEQRVVKREASQLWAHAKDRQRTQVQLRLNSLSRKIEAWSKHQILYMGSVAGLRVAHDRSAVAKNLPEQQAYDVPLWLPSAVKLQVPFDHSLAEIEWRIREAAAHEALDRIRRNLQLRAHLTRFKKRHVRGQGASTRARNAIDTVQGHVDSAALEYRVAYDALASLASILNKSDWWRVLRPLGDNDVRELSAGEEGQTEGRRKISWIWQTLDTSEDMDRNTELKDSVKVEWCNSRARARAFQQEVQLLEEEMERVRRFFTWKEREWTSKSSPSELTHATDPQHVEALQAYAFRQAGIFKAMEAHAGKLWNDLPAHVQRMRDAISNPDTLETFYSTEYETDVNGVRKRKKRRREVSGGTDSDEDSSSDEEADEDHDA